MAISCWNVPLPPQINGLYGLDPWIFVYFWTEGNTRRFPRPFGTRNDMVFDTLRKRFAASFFVRQKILHKKPVGSGERTGKGNILRMFY